MTQRPKITFEVLRADMKLAAKLIEQYLDEAQRDRVTDSKLRSVVRMLNGATHIVVYEDKLPME